MTIEIVGWTFVIIFITLTSYLIKKIYLKKKTKRDDILMSNKDMSHFGPFSGQFKFKGKKNLLIFLVFSNISFINAAEKDINKLWCFNNGGISEFRTKYGTYVDCLTSEYAYEIEFDYNWKEAIGQSLHYADATGKSPAILLIIKKKTKKVYYKEINKVIRKYNLPIKILLMNE